MSHATTYWQWIAAHQPTNPRGRCAEITARMADAFPELRRVRGHYVCPLDDQRHSHWWLAAPDGSVIDPTADQFPSNGIGEYVEYVGPEPTGHCLNCGALLFNHATFCNETCGRETMEFMKRGGAIFINGQEIGVDGGRVEESKAAEPGKP